MCVCVNWRLCQCIHVCRGCRYWWPCLFGGGGGMNCAREEVGIILECGL